MSSEPGVRNPVPRIGVIGGGQLGQMLALAGVPLGLQCHFLDASESAPAARVGVVERGALDDAKAIAALARTSNVLTFDWENVPASALEGLRGVHVRPSPRALSMAQDRLIEKRLFARLGIPVAAHAPVDSLDDLREAMQSVGPRGILKTRRLGYDGKGQVQIRRPWDLEPAWHRLRGVPLIYERWVPFSSEVSLIAARSAAGEVAFYPLARNVHRDGILHYSVAPLENPLLQRQARRHMSKLLLALRYVGVLALECFVVDGRLIANEMAPRVHNSGHWTIEGCSTSQFENHLRAICGWPLGSTRPRGHAAMVNLIGRMPERDELLRVADASLHDYGKSPRPGRKLGHCTVLKSTAAERDRALRQLLRLIPWT